MNSNYWEDSQECCNWFLKKSSDLCYQSSKDCPDFLFDRLRIRGFRDEPCFPAKRKSSSCQIKLKTMIRNNNGRKLGKCDTNIQKSMRIPISVFHTNKKLFVTIHPKTHLYWNLLIIYGYHFLINHSQTL